VVVDIEFAVSSLAFVAFVDHIVVVVDDELACSQLDS